MIKRTNIISIAMVVLVIVMTASALQVHTFGSDGNPGTGLNTSRGDNTTTAGAQTYLNFSLNASDDTSANITSLNITFPDGFGLSAAMNDSANITLNGFNPNIGASNVTVIGDKVMRMTNSTGGCIWNSTTSNIFSINLTNTGNFTIPTAVGTYPIDVNVTNATGSIADSTVYLTVISGPAARMIAVSGMAQVGVVNTALPQPFVFQVNDTFNNPVTNTAVNFTTISGGSVSIATGTTNTSGQVSTTLTLGTAAGIYPVRCEVNGTPAINSTINATAIAGAWDHWNVTTENGNNETAGTGFNLMITAQDEYDNTVTDYNGKNLTAYAAGYTHGASFDYFTTTATQSRNGNQPVLHTGRLYNNTAPNVTLVNFTAGVGTVDGVMNGNCVLYNASENPVITIAECNVTVSSWGTPLGNNATTDPITVNRDATTGYTLLPVVGGVERINKTVTAGVNFTLNVILSDDYGNKNESLDNTTLDFMFVTDANNVTGCYGEEDWIITWNITTEMLNFTDGEANTTDEFRFYDSSQTPYILAGNLTDPVWGVPVGYWGEDTFTVVPNVPRYILIEPLTPDRTNFSADFNASNPDEHSVQINVTGSLDRYCNPATMTELVTWSPVSDTAHTFDRGATTAPVAGQTNNTFNFTDTDAARVAPLTYPITAEYPGAILNGTVNVTMNIGLPNAANCTVSENIDSIPADGISSTTLTLVIRDSWDNLVPNWGGAGNISINSSRGLTDEINNTAPITNSSGVAVVTVNSTTDGAAVIRVCINSSRHNTSIEPEGIKEIVGSPIVLTFTTSLADPYNSRIDLIEYPTPTTAKVSVRAMDGSGSLVRDASVWLHPNSTADLTWTPDYGITDSSGYANFTFATTSPGAYTVNATIGNVTLLTYPNGTNQTVDLVFGISEIVITPEHLVPADNNGTFTIEVTARDQVNDIVPNATVTLYSNRTGDIFWNETASSAGSFTGNADANGTFTVYLKSSLIGTAEISANITDGAVDPTNETCTFSNPANASDSWIQLWGHTIPADGVTSAWVGVHVVNDTEDIQDAYVVVYWNRTDVGGSIPQPIFSGRADVNGWFFNQFNQTIPGTYEITAQVHTFDGMTDITNYTTNGTIVFESVVAGPVNVTASKDTVIANWADYAMLTIWINDTFRQTLSNQTLTIFTNRSCDRLDPPSEWVTDAEGYAYVNISSNVSGASRVTVKLGELDNASVVINFVEGDYLLLLDREDDYIIANGIDLVNISARLWQWSGAAYDIPVVGVNLTFNSTPIYGLDDGDTPSPTYRLTDSNGFANITLSSIYPGESNVTAVVTENDTVGSDYTHIKKNPGEIHANSTIAASPTRVAADGYSHSVITATVYNITDELALEGILPEDIRFVSDRGTTDSFPTHTTYTDANGKTTSRVSSTTVGTANISVEVYANGTWVTIGSECITFLESLVNPYLTTIVNVTSKNVLIDENITILVTARNNDGDPVEGASVELGYEPVIGTPTLTGIGPVSTNVTGHATFNLSSSTAAMCDITAKVDYIVDIRDNIENATFGHASSLTPVIEPVPADGCSRAVVNLTVRDVNYNPIANVSVTGVATTLGSVSSYDDVTDAYGRATIYIVSDTVGNATISVTNIGGNYSVDPVNVTFGNASNVTNSTLWDFTHTATADGADTVWFVVQAIDAHGIAVENAEINVTGVRIGCTNDTLSATGRTDDSGWAWIPVTSTIAGTFDFTVKIGCDSILPADNDTEVTFQTSPAGPGYVDPTTAIVIANGQSFRRINITVYDSVSGNPLPDQAVLVESDRSEDVLSAPAATDENGETFVTVSSTKNGTSLISASVNDTPIGYCLLVFYDQSADETWMYDDFNHTEETYDPVTGWTNHTLPTYPPFNGARYGKSVSDPANNTTIIAGSRVEVTRSGNLNTIVVTVLDDDGFPINGSNVTIWSDRPDVEITPSDGNDTTWWSYGFTDADGKITFEVTAPYSLSTNLVIEADAPYDSTLARLDTANPDATDYDAEDGVIPISFEFVTIYDEAVCASQTLGDNLPDNGLLLGRDGWIVINASNATGHWNGGAAYTITVDGPATVTDATGTLDADGNAAVKIETVCNVTGSGNITVTVGSEIATISYTVSKLDMTIDMPEQVLLRGDHGTYVNMTIVNPSDQVANDVLVDYFRIITPSGTDVIATSEMLSYLMPGNSTPYRVWFDAQGSEYYVVVKDADGIVIEEIGPFALGEEPGAVTIEAMITSTTCGYSIDRTVDAEIIDFTWWDDGNVTTVVSITNVTVINKWTCDTYNATTYSPYAWDNLSYDVHVISPINVTGLTKDLTVYWDDTVTGGSNTATYTNGTVRDFHVESDLSGLGLDRTTILNITAWVSVDDHDDLQMVVQQVVVIVPEVEITVDVDNGHTTRNARRGDNITVTYNISNGGKYDSGANPYEIYGGLGLAICAPDGGRGEESSSKVILDQDHILLPMDYPDLVKTYQIPAQGLPGVYDIAASFTIHNYNTTAMTAYVDVDEFEVSNLTITDRCPVVTDCPHTNYTDVEEGTTIYVSFDVKRVGDVFEPYGLGNLALLPRVAIGPADPSGYYYNETGHLSTVADCTEDEWWTWWNATGRYQFISGTPEELALGETMTVTVPVNLSEHGIIPRATGTEDTFEVLAFAGVTLLDGDANSYPVKLYEYGFEWSGFALRSQVVPLDGGNVTLDGASELDILSNVRLNYPEQQTPLNIRTGEVQPMIEDAWVAGDDDSITPTGYAYPFVAVHRDELITINTALSTAGLDDVEARLIAEIDYQMQEYCDCSQNPDPENCTCPVITKRITKERLATVLGCEENTDETLSFYIPDDMPNGLYTVDVRLVNPSDEFDVWDYGTTGFIIGYGELAITHVSVNPSAALYDFVDVDVTLKNIGEYNVTVDDCGGYYNGESYGDYGDECNIKMAITGPHTNTSEWKPLCEAWDVSCDANVMPDETRTVTFTFANTEEIGNYSVNVSLVSEGDSVVCEYLCMYSVPTTEAFNITEWIPVSMVSTVYTTLNGTAYYWADGIPTNTSGEGWPEWPDYPVITTFVLKNGSVFVLAEEINFTTVTTYNATYVTGTETTWHEWNETLLVPLDTVAKKVYDDSRTFVVSEEGLPGDANGDGEVSMEELFVAIDAYMAGTVDMAYLFAAIDAYMATA